MTKNFKQKEFMCHCGCGEMRISPTIVLLAQLIRDNFKVPAKITSGCRCLHHNSKVGGALNSQHKPKGDELCHAMDIQVEGVPPEEVYNFMDDLFPYTLGLGLYDSWVHVDDRLDGRYRWGK